MPRSGRMPSDRRASYTDEARFCAPLMVSSVERGVEETPEETLRVSNRIPPGRKSGKRPRSSERARSTARILGVRVVPMAMSASLTFVENERKTPLDEVIGKDRAAGGANRFLDGGALPIRDCYHHAATPRRAPPP